MKKIISLILVITIMLLVGCAETTADTKYIQNGNSKCEIVVDKKTGVNYIIYHYGNAGGMTVRLNADGTPYVSEVNGDE